MKKIILILLFLASYSFAFAQYSSYDCYRKAEECMRNVNYYTRQANDAQHWAHSYYNSARTANDPSHFISKAQSYEREAKEHMYRAQRYMNEANEWRQRGDMLQRQGK